MKKAILIQARLSSARFPKKMMSLLGNVPLTEFVYNRCAKSKKADVVAIVTSDEASDDQLFEYCISKGMLVFRGSLDNVLKRYVEAALYYGSSLVCRVCGDSPFVDIDLMDSMFEMVERERLDYIAPNKKSCVAGLDSEVLTLEALKRSLKGSTAKDEFEHVTLHIKNNPGNFKTRYLETDLKPNGLEKACVTVDYPKDLELCNNVLKSIGSGYSFGSKDILAALKKGM
jgi:spore coat polysaccharide biosynthesis protein SpsF